MLETHVTRRRSIVFAGTALAVGATGLALGSQNARAEVTGDFSVADATFTPEDNHLAALWTTVSGDWQFNSLQTQPAEWRTYLLADGQGNPGDWEAIGMTSGSVSTTDATGSYAVRGEVTAASHYDAVDVSDGTPVKLSIPLSVLFMVRDSGGETLATAEAMDTVTVTVEPGGSVSVVGGTGTVHGQDDTGDPTPTVPGGG